MSAESKTSGPIDRAMRRIWVSPWTQLAVWALCGWLASTYKTFSGWWWFWFAMCAAYFLRFLDAGRKRWGSPR